MKGSSIAPSPTSLGDFRMFRVQRVAVFLVFAVVLVVVDFGNEVFLDTANGFAFESETFHALSD